MKLYCYPCNALHEFTASEVERIVYTLQAQEADAATSTPCDLEACNRILCLRDFLAYSYDADMYQEFTQQQVDNRRSLERKVL